MTNDAVKALLSDDCFSVNGTLIEAWASMKSLRRKDGSGEPPVLGRNGERGFHSEKRSNETRASTLTLTPGSIARDPASLPSWPIWAMF